MIDFECRHHPDTLRMVGAYMSVIESRLPVLVLSYHNCEIYCCHLDGYKDHTQALFRRLAEIETCFASSATRRTWFNVDDSVMSKEVLDQLVNCIVRLQPKLVKISFVGFGRKQRVFEQLLSKSLQGAILNRAYFEDAELAKEWLL